MADGSSCILDREQRDWKVEKKISRMKWSYANLIRFQKHEGAL